MDWVGEEKKRRDTGHKRPLLQTEHWAMNARYPGETLEYCCNCNQPTGRAGKADDSLYTEDDEGPFCWDCWERLGHNARNNPPATDLAETYRT